MTKKLDVYSCVLKDQNVVVRAYEWEKDAIMVKNLEKKCELVSKRSLCFLSNVTDDPLCRIRCYNIRIILVAELVENKEVVGVIRGCMKCMYCCSRNDAKHVTKIGYILGLRVSPQHRRSGIGLKLVRSVECWATTNGAQYISLATDDNNVASLSLFMRKLNYVISSSLIILAQPIHHAKKNRSHNIKIEKLTVEQSIAIYQSELRPKMGFFPADTETILRDKLNLGTWVSYFKGETWVGGKFRPRSPCSWAVVSIWKTFEAYKLQTTGASPVKCFPCFGFHSSCDLVNRPLGFFFLYGLHGEGPKVGNLMKALWWFACDLAKKEKECNGVVTELGSDDPLRHHIPCKSSTYHINDLWLMKKANDGVATPPTVAQLFVDPRDF